jgi:hypothetical protein
MTEINTDYLIIGSGAVGLAFADTLIEESNADIVIVDRHGKPGGHWNDAYSFVALHQPSAFYGVNSTPLGSNRKDLIGVNKGLYELASGPEVSGYFDSVMRQRLLPSGRVRYFPMSDYRGDGHFVSLLSGKESKVTVARKQWMPPISERQCHQRTRRVLQLARASSSLPQMACRSFG